VRWYTHIIGMLCVLAVVSRFAPLTALGLSLGIVGALLPDLAENALRLRHRGKYAHNLLTGFAILGVSVLAEPGAYTLGLGYLHHLVLDASTREGVYAGAGRVRGRLNSMNPLHNALVILLHLLAVAAVAKI